MRVCQRFGLERSLRGSRRSKIDFFDFFNDNDFVRAENSFPCNRVKLVTFIFTVDQSDPAIESTE
jgi:hypothetical protein